MARDEAATWQIQIKPRPWERKRVPPRIMTTANTDTSHTNLRLVKWCWNIYTQVVAHHRWKSLTSDFSCSTGPIQFMKRNAPKNSLYCWLGSGIKSRALCCGLVSFSSGLRWWMRSSWSDMWVTLDAHWGRVSILLQLKYMYCFNMLCTNVESVNLRHAHEITLH